ncbi:WD40 repeat-like protein [Pleurotus eryngii]|uniref:Probable cytosolic iron-sulfur protein assembly protein 1 n=1 Tax=Pleurotus eryngii TaxID=5323 RepID=A0A9P6D594_PLEER|nr:WD40 repeat-like protein [Pleurotus eryngii]
MSRFKIVEVAELKGHDDRAWNIAWNPAKPLLASCSADKTVRLYHYDHATDSSDLRFTHNTTISTGHTKTVRAVAWSPSGLSLATASFDANVGIWEQEGGNEGEGPNAGEWECASLLEGHETECKSVAYSSSGTLLASCSRDKTVWVWEVQPDADFECLGVLMEHTQDVKCVAWHPHEEILASASYDDTIRLYIDDPSDDWFCFATLKGHDSTVWCVSWSPDGRYLASSSDDKTVRIWKRVKEHSWESVLAITGHERSVYSISWGVGKSDDGASLGWLASASGDGQVIVWELTKPSDSDTAPMSSTPPGHSIIAKLEAAHGVYDVNAVSWCPRQGYEDILATAGDDCSVRVWKVVAA